MQLINTQDQQLAGSVRPDLPPEERSSVESMLRRLDHLLRTSPDCSMPANENVGTAALEAARRQLRERRERERLFGPEVVAEPAWDVLLELFVAGEEGRELGSLAASSGLAVAEPAVLRCVAHLVSAKLVVRHGRAGAMSVMLSNSATTRMCDYFKRTAVD